MTNTNIITPIIAIDGPAASGKGTLARNIAAALGYAHMDTGALYRAVAYEVLQAGGDPDDESQAIRAAHNLIEKINAASCPDNALHNVSAEGESDVAMPPPSFDKILDNPALREDHVGSAASKVAAVPAVRTAMIQLQRDFAKSPAAPYKGAVLDGRDIGTIIAPQAPVKFFITADTETRAKRRFKELQSRGINATYGTVLADLRERDARDAGRATSPMIPADDAYHLDTSTLTPDQALEKALEVIASRLS